MTEYTFKTNFAVGDTVWIAYKREPIQCSISYITYTTGKFGNFLEYTLYSKQFDDIDCVNELDIHSTKESCQQSIDKGGFDYYYADYYI